MCQRWDSVWDGRLLEAALEGPASSRSGVDGWVLSEVAWFAGFAVALSSRRRDVDDHRLLSGGVFLFSRARCMALALSCNPPLLPHAAWLRQSRHIHWRETFAASLGVVIGEALGNTALCTALELIERAPFRKKACISSVPLVFRSETKAQESCARAILATLKLHICETRRSTHPLTHCNPMSSTTLRTLLRLPSATRQCLAALTTPARTPTWATRPFSSSTARSATYNQVLRGCRVEQRARKPTSPALVDRPEMKGVCVRVGTTKPKKPNSGERKVARVRLSSGKVITAYIPGEGRSDGSCAAFRE